MKELFTESEPLNTVGIKCKLGPIMTLLMLLCLLYHKKMFVLTMHINLFYP